MARKHRRRCTAGSQPIDSEVVNVDTGRTMTPSNKEKKTACRKRKSRSETPKQINSSNRPRVKRIKSISSVHMVKVVSSRSSAQRRKYFASSKRNKRRQSHISVITISSSDEEDESHEKTADWLSKMDMEIINMSTTEEPFPSGDIDLWQSESVTREIAEAEKIRPMRSCMCISSPPESTFTPICASTPQQGVQMSLAPPFTMSQENKSESIVQIYKGPSFLESPMRNLSLNATAISIIETPHTFVSPQPYSKGENRAARVPTLGSRFSRFYFGPSQNSLFGDKESSEQMNSDSDVCYFEAENTASESNGFSVKEAITGETDMRSLEQIPSSSQAPVSEPVLDFAGANKSKGRNT